MLHLWQAGQLYPWRTSLQRPDSTLCLMLPFSHSLRPPPALSMIGKSGLSRATRGLTAKKGKVEGAAKSAKKGKAEHGLPKEARVEVNEEKAKAKEERTAGRFQKSSKASGRQRTLGDHSAGDQTQLRAVSMQNKDNGVTVDFTVA